MRSATAFRNSISCADGWAARTGGPMPTYWSSRIRSTFTVTGGAPATKDLFDGIDPTWNRLPAGSAVKTILDEAIRNWEPAHPEKSIPALTMVRPLIAAMTDPLAKVKLTELDETIALCAGLFVEAQARQPEVAPGATLNVTT